MKQISKKDLATLALELTELGEKYDEIVAAVEKANELIAEFNADDTARNMLAQFAEDAETYAEERSEKWAESEAGEAYTSWAEELREMADGADEEMETIDPPDRPDWLDAEPRQSPSD